MSTVQYRYLKGRIPELAALVAQTEARYSEDSRTQYLTMSALHHALETVVKAAADLENLMGMRSLPGLFDQAVAAVGAVENIVAEFDIQRLRTDAIYAGGKKEAASLAVASADAAEKYCEALKELFKTFAELDRARLLREEFEGNRKSARYAVAVETYVHVNGSGAMTFDKGIHCPVDRDYKDGVVVGCKGYTVFLPYDVWSAHFRIVTGDQC